MKERKRDDSNLLLWKLWKGKLKRDLNIYIKKKVQRRVHTL